MSMSSASCDDPAEGALTFPSRRFVSHAADDVEIGDHVSGSSVLPRTSNINVVA